MKRLHSFILKSFLGPLLFTFLICMFVLLMQFLWRYIDELVGKGLEWTIIFEFLAYVSATLVPMALPLSILLASIMAFGNLGENYELTAMKAAGISLFKIMKPLIILVVFISAGAFYFSNILMPIASLKLSTLLYDIQHQNPELILKEGVFTNDLKGYSIKIGTIDKQTGMIHDLLIYDHRGPAGNKKVIVADSGLMNFSEDKATLNLILYSGNSYEEVVLSNRKKRKNYPLRRIKFQENKTVLSLPGGKMNRTDESAFKNSSYRMFNLRQLNEQQDSLEMKLLDKQKNSARLLIAQRLFNKESRSYRNDSVKRIMVLADTLNSDSLFQSLNLQDKLNSISSALNYSRKSKESVIRRNGDNKASSRWIRKYINEKHMKLTLPTACFIFFFIGAPLGAIIRKGGLGLPVIISVFIFLTYYIISMFGKRFSEEGVMTPFLGMWLSSILIFPLGVVLTYKAATDSSVMNIDVYIKFFKRLNIFKKKKNENQ